jgi:hypothetical protein
MNYNEYLFYCLLKIYDKGFAELEYDLQYEKIAQRYLGFTQSRFNVDTKGEYDCIIDYLKDKYGQPCIVECDLTYLRNLFIAGTTFGEEYALVQEGKIDEDDMEVPDFGDYIMLTKGIDVDFKLDIKQHE